MATTQNICFDRVSAEWQPHKTRAQFSLHQKKPAGFPASYLFDLIVRPNTATTQRPVSYLFVSTRDKQISHTNEYFFLESVSLSTD
jgi:hypothetical protein